jgi:3-isopropylmalate/(R)-2-methylmalate dehydratase small subunit
METGSSITRVTGQALPVRGSDIDTDRIIPARYLRTVTFEDLGAHAFEDDRLAAGGRHPFDEPRFRGARVLVANANFGCGSSREHAPQALMRWGIRAFVAESFAEIFFGNCVALGLPCVSLAPVAIEQLQDAVEGDPTMVVALDLEELRVSWSGNVAVAALPAGPRQQFITGEWDSLGQLLAAGERIEVAAAGLPYTRGFAAP